MSRITIVLVGVLTVTTTVGATTVTDDFNDNTLDASKWSIVNQTLFDITSSVLEQNQRIEFTSRGYLNTVEQFDPSGLGTVRVTGRWTFVSGADDFMQVATRSSGTPSGTFGELDTGLELLLTGHSSGFLIVERSGGTNTFLAQNTSVPVNAGDVFDFEVIDDGLNFTATITEIGGDGTTATLTAASTLSSSTNLVTFHNRESRGEPVNRMTESYLDDVHIERTLETQVIKLAWGEDVPLAFVPAVDAAGNQYTIRAPGVTPAATVSESDKADITQRLTDMFVNSGIENIAITDQDVLGATNIYFADNLGTGLLGMAFTGIDQFNERAADDVAVFLTGTTELDAEIAAHEVGHSLGLRHVNPSAASDPSDLSIMDYDDALGDFEIFVDAVSEIKEPPSNPTAGTGITHNPVYHLERYIDGVDHDDLVMAGTLPGTWDLSAGEGGAAARVDVSLDFGGFDQLLHDVQILTGLAGPEAALEELGNFQAISISQLEQLSWGLDAGTVFRILAASTPGGALDVILGIGDPFETSNLGVLSVLGDSPMMLQLVTNSQGEFTTLANGTVTAVAIPEPPTFVLSALGLLGLAFYGLRGRRKLAA